MNVTMGVLVIKSFATIEWSDLESNQCLSSFELQTTEDGESELLATSKLEHIYVTTLAGLCMNALHVHKV